MPSAASASIAGVFTLRVAVSGQVIGPQRVDGDQHDRAADRRRRARVAPAADRGQTGADGDENEDEGESEGRDTGFMADG